MKSLLNVNLYFVLDNTVCMGKSSKGQTFLLSKIFWCRRIPDGFKIIFFPNGEYIFFLIRCVSEFCPVLQKVQKLTFLKSL